MIGVLAAYLSEAVRHVRAYRTWALGGLSSAAVVASAVVMLLPTTTTEDRATVAAVRPLVPADTTGAWLSVPDVDDYAFLRERHGEPARFSPCAGPIEVSYNPDNAPYDAADDVAASVRRLTAGLGHPVDYLGTTDLRGEDLREGAVQSPAILVTWVQSPKDIDAPPDVVGQTSTLIADGLITGSVISLVATGGLAAGPGPGSWQATMLHELGHAVGLSHVDDPGQVMFPQATPTRPASWGDGDLTGLSRLADAACISDHRRKPSDEEVVTIQ